MPGVRRLSALVLVAIVLTPVTLATSIRGAKVGLTNPGSFYQDFRSLQWLKNFKSDPRTALEVFWRDYFGIRFTLQSLAADSRTKLIRSHDYFAGVTYLQDNSHEDAKVLLFRDARFFYYSDRKGVYAESPEFDRRAMKQARNPEEKLEVLLAQGFTHVLIDSYSLTQSAYAFSHIHPLLQEPAFVETVLEFGETKVYRLRTLTEAVGR